MPIGGYQEIEAVTAPNPQAPEGRCVSMIKWNSRSLRVALALAALASYVVSAGATIKWV